jgi:hypothetical protein
MRFGRYDGCLYCYEREYKKTSGKRQIKTKKTGVFGNAGAGFLLQEYSEIKI